MLNGVCAVILIQDRTVKVTSVFDKMTYWNLETPPNPDDRVVMAMDWPELAEAVSHRRITFLIKANTHAVHTAYVIA